jgi:CelD/BcsL family acetyltransferase involved in cellulose biosynthesis
VGSGGSPFEISVQSGGIEIIEHIADEWRALASQSHDDEPFYRPEWISAIIRAFFPHIKILVITARTNRALRFVLPLLQERALFFGIPVLRLRSPANVHSCRFDAIRCASPEGEQVLLAAWRFLKEKQPWDMLEFSDIPDESSVELLVRGAEFDGFRTAKVPMRPNPVVRIADLEKLPRNARLRGKLRQAHRELSKTGPLQLRRIETADQEVLDRFYELESRGWKGREGGAIQNDATAKRFYDEIAEVAARRGYLCVYTLELGGRLLAAHFGLAHQGRYYSPKLAYDESFKERAVGHLIVSEILQDCARRGIHTYDITGPDDEWKMKWTGDVRRRSLYYVFRDNAAGSLAYALRFKVRPALKRLLQPSRESPSS